MKNVVVTRGIQSLIESESGFKEFVSQSVQRHIAKDWGEVSEEDAKLNDEQCEFYALSAYTFEHKLKIWVNTEGEYIIVLLPSEY